jgi:hypothetical protein
VVGAELHKTGLEAAVEIYLSPHPKIFWRDAALENVAACMENAISAYHSWSTPRRYRDQM